MEEVKLLYEQDRLFQARQVLQALGDAADLEDLVVQRLLEDVRQVEALLEELESLEGWVLVRDDENVQTFYRHEENTPLHSVRMQGLVAAPLLNILSLVNEAELFTDWIPLIRKPCEIPFSKFRKLVHMEVMCFPLARRDIVMSGFAVDWLEEDKVVVSVRSATEAELAANGTGKKPWLMDNGHVRMDCAFAGMLLEPRAHGRETYVTMIGNIDPKLLIVPNWVVNQVTKQLMHWMFCKFRQRAQVVEGTRHERCIQEDARGVYAEINSRLSKYFC